MVDATDHIVTPGFVDIHTHYDGQVTWDPLLTPSSGCGNFDIIFDHFWRTCPAPPHLTRAVCHVLLGTLADRVLIGAWNPTLCPIWGFRHGVTTLMFGNCGIGFAPCRPLDRTQLIDILVSVEDIPGTALHAGIRWDWTTFPEYLDSLSRTETVGSRSWRGLWFH